ncbi:hypothetical protein B0H34DRAFT_692229 [Crassisporium funariophilum]|nr:hypothetical protein B0H34DRAFT_692229 [Crassisporium funariophilum]
MVALEPWRTSTRYKEHIPKSILLSSLTFFTMHLYLSSPTPWNTTYCTESGQVIYKSDAPLKLGARPITIKRIRPSITPPTAGTDNTLRDHFAHLAEIEYHSFRNSRIRYAEVDVPVNEFFKKQGWGWYGRNRVFKGPDGKEYTWHLTSRVSKLFTNDTAKTPIASFHRRRLGVLTDPRPASLEIFPAGEHMTDLIVVTFVYVEKLRTDRETAVESSGGGGG